MRTLQIWKSTQSYIANLEINTELHIDFANLEINTELHIDFDSLQLGAKHFRDHRNPYVDILCSNSPKVTAKTVSCESPSLLPLPKIIHFYIRSYYSTYSFQACLCPIELARFGVCSVFFFPNLHVLGFARFFFPESADLLGFFFPNSSYVLSCRSISKILYIRGRTFLEKRFLIAQAVTSCNVHMGVKMILWVFGRLGSWVTWRSISLKCTFGLWEFSLSRN